MTANKLKINITLSKHSYDIIKQLSNNKGVSMSFMLKTLIKEALELREDIALEKFARKRKKTFIKSQILSHNKVWA